ncbi:MAG: tetratricopeptide repeat protein [Gemmatimonadota bacterium]
MANAGLALGYVTVGHGPAQTPDTWARARAAAERALKLDSTLAEAHAALADIKLYYEWDWAGAEQAFRWANELNPSLAMNHFHYAWYLALVGRLDEAIVEHERAQELDPLTSSLSASLGWLYLYVGQYDVALNEARKALELNPNDSWGFLTLGVAYSLKGMHEEAIAAHEKAVAINPLWKWALGRS